MTARAPGQGSLPDMLQKVKARQKPGEEQETGKAWQEAGQPDLPCPADHDSTFPGTHGLIWLAALADHDRAYTGESGKVRPDHDNQGEASDRQKQAGHASFSGVAGFQKPCSQGARDREVFRMNFGLSARVDDLGR